MPPRSATLTILVALATGAAGCAPDATLVAHQFDGSTDGWLIAGDTGMAEPRYRPEGGRSGGYISGADEALGETWYFRAPDAVLIGLGAAEGGTLRYSLKLTSPVEGFLDDDIVIVGPAGRLSYRFPAPPGVEWTDFSVRLLASEGWRWNWNAPATDAQMRSVLADPSRLEIRGEYSTGPDEGGLDSFVLTGGGSPRS